MQNELSRPIMATINPTILQDIKSIYVFKYIQGVTVTDADIGID